MAAMALDESRSSSSTTLRLRWMRSWRHGRGFRRCAAEVWSLGCPSSPSSCAVKQRQTWCKCQWFNMIQWYSTIFNDIQCFFSLPHTLSLAFSILKEHVTNIFWQCVPLMASVQRRKCILLIGGLMVTCHVFIIHIYPILSMSLFNTVKLRITTETHDNRNLIWGRST